MIDFCQDDFQHITKFVHHFFIDQYRAVFTITLDTLFVIEDQSSRNKGHCAIFE
ncbi:Uncharacterised protein [Vibrio cholerae]|nr:Uncharacterised protein [Vibrio cholerae]